MEKNICVKILLVIIAGFITVLVAGLLWLSRPLPDSSVPRNALNSDYLIAHAGGGIDGEVYTNSKEAVINSLNNGYRFIELDLYQTADSDFVCLHNLSDFNKMTASDYQTIDSKTFISKKLYGKLTPMTLQDAIEIWKEKNFCFVTDKISDPEILNRYFVANRDRVIVEAFTMEDYIKLEEDGYKPMLSIMAMNVRGLARYVYNTIRYHKRIRRIVTNSSISKYTLRIYRRLGAECIAVYSIDDAVSGKKYEREYVEKYAGKEVDFVYTDFLIPQIKNEFN